ncbi:MAG: 50S ribosomal protein L6 [Bacteroidetes bacterium]|nr:50S ribosomal protein L6 [Bacteroidota bacterium]
MSRIGKAPITIPTGVEVKIEGNTVHVKGSKGELKEQMDLSIKPTIEDGVLTLSRSSEEKQVKAFHGLYRSLISNMIKGVSEGYVVKQELVGVGFRAQAAGQQLSLSLGFSHPIIMELPKEIKVGAETEKGKNPIVTMESCDKQLLGQAAAKLRSLRKPEPYKGKGIRFVGEQVRRKAGKTSSK